MKRLIIFKVLSTMVFMGVLLLPSFSYAMNSEEDEVSQTCPQKKKKFFELLESALGGNKEDDEFIRVLLSLDLELTRWIDPQEAYRLLEQTASLGNGAVSEYKTILRRAQQTLKVKELKEALKPFEGAVSRGYTPALINLGEIYMRLFLVEQHEVKRVNAQIAVEAFSESCPPPRIEESKTALYNVLKWGKEAFQKAETSQELNRAASLIVSALLGKWMESDKVANLCPTYDVAHSLESHMGRLQTYITRFENKKNTFNPENTLHRKKLDFYMSHLESLRKFMEGFPAKIQDPYSYLPFPSASLKISLDSSAFCLSKPLSEESKIEAVYALKTHYEQKAERRKNEGCQLRSSLEAETISLEELRILQTKIDGCNKSQSKAEEKEKTLQLVIDFDKRRAEQKKRNLIKSLPIFGALWPQ
jgi:hypothetical protein